MLVSDLQLEKIPKFQIIYHNIEKIEIIDRHNFRLHMNSYRELKKLYDADKYIQ